MLKLPSILEMLQSGVHFGHQISRRHPKMAQYIFGERNGVHVIDLEKTKAKLEEVLAAVKKMAAEGKTILFISTKPQARDTVKQAAVDCGMPYLVERWLGGLITNFSEIKKLIQKYNTMKTEQASGEWEKYTKKEQVEFAKKLDNMHATLAGLSGLTKLPDALFIPSLHREKTAVTEANKMNVAIVGVADTNANPNKATLVVPANDDGVNSIKMVVGLVAEAVKTGREEWEKVKMIGATEKTEKNNKIEQNLTK